MSAQPEYREDGLLAPIALAVLIAWAATAGIAAIVPPSPENGTDMAAVSLERYVGNPFCLAILAVGLWALSFAALEALGLAQDEGQVRALRHLTGRRSAGFEPPQVPLPSLRDRADHLADAWESRFQRRTGLVWYATWLLPLMGFVGTVVGISAAIGDLSGIFDETTDRETAIGDVLAGLRFAFDTTFLGLVLVIPVMGAAVLLRMRADRVRGQLLTRALSGQGMGAT